MIHLYYHNTGWVHHPDRARSAWCKKGIQMPTLLALVLDNRREKKVSFLLISGLIEMNRKGFGETLSFWRNVRCLLLKRENSSPCPCLAIARKIVFCNWKIRSASPWPTLWTNRISEFLSTAETAAEYFPVTPFCPILSIILENVFPPNNTLSSHT